LVKQFQSGNLYHRVALDERCWVHHNASLLTPEDVNYLEGLPVAIRFSLDGIEYGMTHLYREYEEITSLHAYHHFWADAFGESECLHSGRLILGHTHRQSVRYLSDETLWLNPGSVSYRRRDDPDQSAHYATLVDGAISLRRVNYDLDPLRRAIQGVTLKESEMQAARFFFGERPNELN
jgi:predicted phosphodiesterase